MNDDNKILHVVTLSLKESNGLIRHLFWEVVWGTLGDGLILTEKAGMARWEVLLVDRTAGIATTILVMGSQLYANDFIPSCFTGKGTAAPER